jgi:uncharacterized protein (DUF952 family)
VSDRHVRHLIRTEDYYGLGQGEPWQPESLASEGFIHCTREPDVLLGVANRLYRQAPGEYLVLVIDPDRLTSPLKYEAAPGGDPFSGHLFPHIYGPLNRAAIVDVHPARRAADGTFLGV